jgi:hypothetical protein
MTMISTRKKEKKKRKEKKKETCEISTKGTLLTMFQQSDLCLLHAHPS